MRPCFLYITVSQQLQSEPLETDPHGVMTTEEKLPKGSDTRSKTWPLKGVLALTPSPVQAPTQGPSKALFCLFPMPWHPPPPPCVLIVHHVKYLPDLFQIVRSYFQHQSSIQNPGFQVCGATGGITDVSMSLKKKKCLKGLFLKPRIYIHIFTRGIIWLLSQ